MKKQSLIVIILALVTVIGFGLFFVSSRDSSLIKSHFGIRLPQDMTVIARKVNTFGFDGSVAWVLKSGNQTATLSLVPDGFIELPSTDDSSSKYREIIGHFRGELPEAFSGFGKTRVFLGGPYGNSFIGLSESLDLIILFRFWT